MSRIYRITTQVLNPDGTTGDVVDIVEFESEREPEHASSLNLWDDYKEECKRERFEVFNLKTDESHGGYPTLDEARGAVKFDRLTHYEIWDNNIRVECCDPYEGDDDRVKQGLGQPNASEAGY